MTFTEHPRVLVIDDDSDIRAYLKTMLAELGYSSIEAPNGSEALRLLANGDADIALSDIQMPVMSGTALLEASSRLGLDIPFLMVSRFEEREDLLRCARLGAEGFIPKPLRIEDISNGLKRVQARRLQASTPSFNAETTTLKEILSTGCRLVDFEHGAVCWWSSGQTGLIEMYDQVGSRPTQGSTAPDNLLLSSWFQRFLMRMKTTVALTDSKMKQIATGIPTSVRSCVSSTMFRGANSGITVVLYSREPRLTELNQIDDSILQAFHSLVSRG